jgi:hypothetical protein
VSVTRDRNKRRPVVFPINFPDTGHGHGHDLEKEVMRRHQMVGVSVRGIFITLFQTFIGGEK